MFVPQLESFWMNSDETYTGVESGHEDVPYFQKLTKIL